MKAEPLSPVLQSPWNNGGSYRKHSNSVSSRNGSFHPKYQGYHRSRSPSKSPPRSRKGLPVFKNLSWVRPPTPPKDPTTTVPNVSLLARIEPASDSLLHRISDSAEASTSTSEPSASVPKPVRKQTAQEIEAEAFAEMLIRESEAVMIRQAQEKFEAETLECLPKPEENEGVAPLATSNDVSTVSMHAEDTAIEVKPPSQLSPEDVPMASQEADNKSDVSLPKNDPALRAASPRQPDEKPVDLTTTDIPISKDAPQNKTVTSPSRGSRQHELVEQARRLFLSIIVKKVQYHAPQATIQNIEEKAMSLLTDDRCSELMKLAMDAKEQMRSRGRRGVSQEREREHEREGDQAPARRDSRAHKRPHSSDHIRNHTRGGDRPDDNSYWERGSWSSHARGDRSYGSRERGRDLTRPASNERFHGRNPVRGRSRESRIDDYRPVTREPSLRDNMRDDSHIEPVEKGMPKKARRSRSRSPPGGVSRPTKRARSKSPVPSALRPSRSPVSEVARKDKKEDIVVPRTPSISTVTPPPTKKATPKMPKAMRVGLSTSAIESTPSVASAASVASVQGASVPEGNAESNKIEHGSSGAPEKHVDVADQPMTNQDESKSTGADVDDHGPGQPEVVVIASEVELAEVLLKDAEKECLRSSPMDISDLPPSDDVLPVATTELAQPMVVESVQPAETSSPLETEKATEKPTLISNDEVIPEELGTEPQTLDTLPVAESSNLITPPVPDVEMITLEEEEEDVRSSPQPEVELVVVIPQENQPQCDDNNHEEFTAHDEFQAEEELQILYHVDEENAIPSAAEEIIEISSEVSEQQDASSDHRYTPLPVPGFWFASVGKSHPDIVETEFYVDKEKASAALRWGRRDISFDANERRHIALYLLCLPVGEVHAVNEKLDRMATPEQVTEAMCTIPTQWPRKGKLIVQFNEGEVNEKTWMPLEFKPGEPLEVSGYIQPGLNKARMIQLDRMDDRIFILYATQVSEEEQQEYAGKISVSVPGKIGRQVPSQKGKGKERQRNTPEVDGT